MPVGDILVGNARCNIEHDDTALALNVVAIAQTAEFLLACSVPHIEANGAAIGIKHKRMHLDTDSGVVYLFKFTRQVPLDKSRLACATITN